MLLIIALETTNLSSSASSNMTCILSRLSLIFPSQSIILSSVFVYESDPGFHLTSGVVSYITSVPSSVTIDGLDVGGYDNTPCRNNVMQMSSW